MLGRDAQRQHSAAIVFARRASYTNLQASFITDSPLFAQKSDDASGILLAAARRTDSTADSLGMTQV